MIVKGTKQLGNFKRGISLYIPKKRTALIPPDGLSLWLKADAGVSKFSYNYVSQIIISGTSNPSFAGTYTANGVPTYNLEDGFVDAYSFTGPAGKSMSWSADEGYFILSSSGEPSDSFYSYDGVNWLVYESYLAQIVITGFSGIYSGANGAYDWNGSHFTRVGGGFFIDEEGLKDVSSETLIATAPENYSGSWTPASYVSSVTLSGAGNTSVNGIYTRSETQIDMYEVSYTKSGGGSIVYEGNEFVINGDSYVDGFNWQVGDPENGGVEPAPTNSFGTSVRSVGSPTSTSSSNPTGSISGSFTTATVNTDYVTAWADQSGNGRNATPESISGNSLVAIGGKSFVSFTNSSMFIPIIWNEVSVIGTIFTVARFNSSSTEDYGSRIFYQQGNSDIFFTRGRIGTNNFYFASLGDAVVSSVPLNNNINYLIETTFDSSSASLFLNGTSVGTGPIEENIGEGETVIGQGEPYKMAEMVVYNRVLTTEERQQVEAYLNAKYAIY